MTPTRRVVTFRIDDDMLQAMDALQERDGISLSEQIRRALLPWLEKKGVLKKAERPRVQPRRRS